MKVQTLLSQQRAVANPSKRADGRLSSLSEELAVIGQSAALSFGDIDFSLPFPPPFFFSPMPDNQIVNIWIEQPIKQQPDYW
jgi:hypothetical protein